MTVEVVDPKGSGHLELLANMNCITLICRRGEIDLCARLLGIAAAGLNENPGLLGFVVAAKFALLSVMLPLLAFSGLAYTNGDLAPNSKSHSSFSSRLTCTLSRQAYPFSTLCVALSCSSRLLMQQCAMEG